MAVESFQERLRRSNATLSSILELLVPGDGDAVARLRRDVVALVEDPLARGALILGPAGTGKSTLARTIALLRFLYLLTPERAKEFLANVRCDGPYRISTESLPWYVELSLPGLAESVAEAQLFGFTADVAARGSVARGRTEGRPSIFEIAARGRADTEAEAPAGARTTRGVVFLDEVGDLSPTLQPKLLGVLTGAPLYRVGGEGKDEYEVRFEGLTLAATWREIDSIREDLRARLGDHVLHMPSLAERTGEFENLCRSVLEEAKAQRRRWLERLLGRKEGASAEAGATRAPASIKGIAKERLEADAARVEAFEIDPATLTKLASVDWRIQGELRGLAQVIRRLMQGMRIEDALLATQTAATTRARGGGVDLAHSIEKLPDGEVHGRSLAVLFALVEERARAQYIAHLEHDEAELQRLAQRLGLDERELRRELSQRKKSLKGHPPK